MQTEQFDLHAEIEERHWWFVARRRILHALVHEALSAPGSTYDNHDGPKQIVDIGCGTGANLAGLAEDYHCTGIDTSADAIHWARQRFPKVEFICGFAPHDLGDTAHQADLFLLTDVLEHVPDDYQFLSDLLAAAKPGAKFLITVPADLTLWSKHDESFGHYRRYNLSRLARVWQDLPVETKLVSYFNSRLYPAVKLLRTWNRRHNRVSGKAGTDFRIPSRPVNRFFAEIFAGERRILLDLLHGRRQHGYRSGVSLVALLEREPGEIEPRTRPATEEPDYFDPVRGELVATG